MPIPLAPPPPQDPKTWPVMEITESGGRVSVVETWPLSTGEVKDIGETLFGAGPNVALLMTIGEPQSCAWRAEQTARFERPGWDVALKSEVAVTASATHFRVEERLLATLNGEVEADARHAHEIPRLWM
jgi:hypothetical protein